MQPETPVIAWKRPSHYLAIEALNSRVQGNRNLKRPGQPGSKPRINLVDRTTILILDYGKLLERRRKVGDKIGPSYWCPECKRYLGYDDVQGAALSMKKLQTEDSALDHEK